MDNTDYTEKLKVCFWDDYVRDKKSRNEHIPAFFKELLEIRDDIEEMIDSENDFHLSEGGRLSGKSSVLQYIVLRRAIKTPGNHYYFTTGKRMAVMTLGWIYKWIEKIEMTNHVLKCGETVLTLDNGSTITVFASENAKFEIPFVTAVFDDIGFFDPAQVLYLIVPMLFREVEHNGSLYFTCERRTKRVDMYAQVGLGLTVAHANEFDVFARVNKLKPEQIQKLEEIFRGK